MFFLLYLIVFMFRQTCPIPARKSGFSTISLTPVFSLRYVCPTPVLTLVSGFFYRRSPGFSMPFLQLERVNIVRLGHIDAWSLKWAEEVATRTHPMPVREYPSLRQTIKIAYSAMNAMMAILSYVNWALKREVNAFTNWHI